MVTRVYARNQLREPGLDAGTSGFLHPGHSLDSEETIGGPQTGGELLAEGENLKVGEQPGSETSHNIII